MMETILVNAEPLMVIVATYFVAQFAFSEVGQKLGSLVWFRRIVAVPCIYVFLGYLSRLLTTRMFFFCCKSQLGETIKSSSFEIESQRPHPTN